MGERISDNRGEINQTQMEVEFNMPFAIDWDSVAFEQSSLDNSAEGIKEIKLPNGQVVRVQLTRIHNLSDLNYEEEPIIMPEGQISGGYTVQLSEEGVTSTLDNPPCRHGMTVILSEDEDPEFTLGLVVGDTTYFLNEGNIDGEGEEGTLVYSASMATCNETGDTGIVIISQTGLSGITYVVSDEPMIIRD